MVEAIAKENKELYFLQQIMEEGRNLMSTWSCGTTNILTSASLTYNSDRKEFTLITQDACNPESYTTTIIPEELVSRQEEEVIPFEKKRKTDEIQEGLNVWAPPGVEDFNVWAPEEK